MIKAQIAPAILLTLTISVFTGICFPVVTWGIAQLLFPYQANGSLIERNGTLVGSQLIGQNFTSPKYFHSRPSAAGSGYDPLSSGGTNLGPTSKKLVAGLQDDPSTKDIDESYVGVEGFAKTYREENGLAANDLVPVDAVTRSASGLDPHISRQNAKLQSVRVAKERSVTPDELDALVDENTEKRFLGLFGDARVNVVKLNLALDAWRSN